MPLMGYRALSWRCPPRVFSVFAQPRYPSVQQIAELTNVLHVKSIVEGNTLDDPNHWFSSTCVVAAEEEDLTTFPIKVPSAHLTAFLLVCKAT
jgi:hypothetical protein